MSDDSSSEDFEDFLMEIESLRADDPEAARKQMLESNPEYGSRPEARLLAADLSWELDGAAAARPLFEGLVGDVPDYADARYALAALYDELGDGRKKTEQFLEVLRLDEGLDHTLDSADEKELADLIRETAQATIEELPEAFRERLTSVPILIEQRPTEALVREGFDPRALGLFEGPTDLAHQNNEPTEAPTRIVLYSANLLAESVDEDQLRAEVETTVLHELGHYFGLDEDELERIGLD